MKIFDISDWDKCPICDQLINCESIEELVCDECPRRESTSCTKLLCKCSPMDYKKLYIELKTENIELQNEVIKLWQKTKRQ